MMMVMAVVHMVAVYLVDPVSVEMDLEMGIVETMENYDA